MIDRNDHDDFFSFQAKLMKGLLAFWLVVTAIAFLSFSLMAWVIIHLISKLL